MSESLVSLGWLGAGRPAGRLLAVLAQCWRARQSAAGTIPEVLRWHFARRRWRSWSFPSASFRRGSAPTCSGPWIASWPRPRSATPAACRSDFSPLGVGLAQCLAAAERESAARRGPAIRGGRHRRRVRGAMCKSALWCLNEGDTRCALLLDVAPPMFGAAGIRVEIATPTTEAATRYAEHLFKRLEEATLRCDSYRGKILSLENQAQEYSGRAADIRVHRLRTVERSQVILPPQTLELLDRNVIHFVRQRPQLSRFHQARKKGLLFYGPPGTGKTHTIHYLAKALEGHTTLLISAEQVQLLDEYMTLARLLQPSVVVVEDVDLIARERTEMRSGCEESLLNRLLNEMDGLREDADVLFILTTNRPEMLEPALASRPGRVDQAIEFPLPDDAGRERLVRLYSEGIAIDEPLVATIVQRTDRVSGAFIKELMRRCVQFHLERGGDGRLDSRDVDGALDEILFRGGSLNMTLLGGRHATTPRTVLSAAAP